MSLDECPTEDTDGVNDHADASNTAGFFDPGSGDFSVEAWVKTTTNGNQVIASKATTWQITVTADAGHVGQAKFSYDNVTVAAYSNTNVDDGAWHHVVAVADRDTATTVYVDAVPGVAGPFDVIALTDTNPVRIGTGPTSGYFTGQIDEVAVYNKALSAARIQVHRRLGAQLENSAPAPTVTAPTDGSSTTDPTPSLAGTAGSAVGDATALTVSIAPDPDAGPLSVFDYDEFGTPRAPTSASRYGYLGGKQRSAELASGVIAMGARSYLPTLGRFLQVDPIDGGSANPYDYVNQDPINAFDLEGLATAGGKCIEGRKGFNRKACEAAGFTITLKGTKYAKKSRLEKLCMMATGATLVGTIKTLLTRTGDKIVVTRLTKAKAVGAVLGAINCDF